MGELMTDLVLAVTLLKVAECPNCDGSGVIVNCGYNIVPGCCGSILPTGECCGNSVPVQIPTQELEQCQWCAERNELIAKYDE